MANGHCQSHACAPLRNYVQLEDIRISEDEIERGETMTTDEVEASLKAEGLL